MVEMLQKLLQGVPPKALNLAPIGELYASLSEGFALFQRYSEIYPVFKEVALRLCDSISSLY
jgi:hypothetical protein